MTDENQVQDTEPKKAKKYKYVPKKDKKAAETNVEAPEVVQENVEAADVVAEDVEPVADETPIETPEVATENVELAVSYQPEAYYDPETPETTSPVMDAIEDMTQAVKKVLRKVPDNFDIIKWRRLGRR